MISTLVRSLAYGSLLVIACPLLAQAPAAPAAPPDPPRTRVYDVKQTVTLKEIPKDAKRVRFWIPIPDDAPAQKVLDLSVAEAPGEWKVVEQPEHANRFLYIDAKPEGKDTLSAVVTFAIR